MPLAVSACAEISSLTKRAAAREEQQEPMNESKGGVANEQSELYYSLRKYKQTCIHTYIHCSVAQ